MANVNLIKRKTYIKYEILQILGLFKEIKVFSVSLCGRKHLSFNHKSKHVQAIEHMQSWLARPHFCNMFVKDGLIRLKLRLMKKKKKH